jgi:hypothetical protein
MVQMILVFRPVPGMSILAWPVAIVSSVSASAPAGGSRGLALA